MARVIGLGTQPINWLDGLKNWSVGVAAFFGQKTLFKTRPIIGAIHALVAWGFSVYLIVNIVEFVVNKSG